MPRTCLLQLKDHGKQSKRVVSSAEEETGLYHTAHPEPLPICLEGLLSGSSGKSDPGAQPLLPHLLLLGSSLEIGGSSKGSAHPSGPGPGEKHRCGRSERGRRRAWCWRQADGAWAGSTVPSHSALGPRAGDSSVRGAAHSGTWKPQAGKRMCSSAG